MVEGAVTGSRGAARALRFGMVLVAVLLGLASFPVDDGLRHVGLAFTAERSWGEVYPHSAFAELGGYDPWGGYDFALRQLAHLAQQLPLPRLTQQFLVVKLLSVLLPLSLLLLCLRRAKLERALDDPASIACAFTVVVFVLGHALVRAGSIRPFILGTFLLAYAVEKRGVVRGALAAALLHACYPYLALVYTGPLAVAHGLRGCRRFAIGVAAAAVAATALAPEGQWTMLLALARAGAVRAATGQQVSELRSAAGDVGTVLAVLAIAAWVVPRLPAASRVLRVPHVLALCFVPAAMLHVRYLGDVVLVCVFIAHGADLTRLLRAVVADTATRWAASWAKPAPSGPAASAAEAPRAGGGARRARPALRGALVLGYAACALWLGSEIVSQHRVIERRYAELAAVPRGARVLTEFGLQYAMLFVRPDLSLVPSCELGVPSGRVREPYVAYFARGRVCELARAVSATHFVGAGAQYLDPNDTACLRALSEASAGRVPPRLRVFGVVP